MHLIRTSSGGLATTILGLVMAALLQIGYCFRTVGSDWRIVNGKESRSGDQPWQVAIFYTDRNQMWPICGGALIDTRHVVTAAHCFDRTRKPEHYTVAVGHRDISKLDWSKVRKPSNISISILNSKNSEVRGDIAIVKLNKPVMLDSTTSIIGLPSRPDDRPTVGTNCIVSGWGAIDKKASTFSTKLNFVKIRIRGNRACKRLYRNIHISQEHVCAGGLTIQNSCHGDSGGPLACWRGGRYVLDGLVSFGPRHCGVVGIPSVYTSTSYYLPWIRHVQMSRTK